MYSSLSALIYIFAGLLQIVPARVIDKRLADACQSDAGLEGPAVGDAIADDLTALPHRVQRHHSTREQELRH